MNQSLSISPTQKEATNASPLIAKLQLIVKQIIVLSTEMLLALPLGWALTKLHFGGIAWIFGGIAAGTVVLQGCRVFYNYSPQPNRVARKVGMGLVGLTVGASNANINLDSLVSGIPIFIFLTLFLLLSGIGIGYIYSRLSKTNILTAMLATVPGGVGVMSSIAADYNRNVTLVALVQAIRVTSVVLLIPFVARTSVGGYLNSPTLPVKGVLIDFAASQLGLLAVVLVLTGIIVYLAITFKIPAGEFFGALVLGATFNSLLDHLPFVSDIHFHPPLLVNIIGQMLLGITIGEYWGEKPNFGKKTVGYALMSVFMTLVAGAIAATLAMQLSSWDWLTCLLVTAPGGSAEMILVSLTLNHNVEVVTTGHLVRLIAINSSLPLWLFLFRRFDGLREAKATKYNIK
ncbi:AbrB family transcriptional regulator [Anabaena sp. FACHB-709]|uniref:AbrB family transcriptional regulator n=2 Tax=Nostocaceae TaxID=1162 RepID=A0ABR7ZDQ2_ANACY|nr:MULTISPECIES: AbrB family transcriptional regulator [Nostocaceae]BAY68876.1 putative ammonia monooxygenase [Trichormus variabilis NIES-23]HBW31562.1 AbrB family transcriptional regulator [Nostoc sp. UBA8866]MBD2170453.1 AbrB family transcriptional regulator [Anabaena cylindrica FACHB-318]MBD2262071.1 AbrB family transcriptional regulator [Anabaena sp. FACHB-709]MBD2271785.1 AbrB family transcriptional regulator [Nostoc sp. PCC 7120 = FACHB-418]